jgi:hypothetical protein
MTLKSRRLYLIWGRQETNTKLFKGHLKDWEEEARIALSCILGGGNEVVRQLASAQGCVPCQALLFVVWNLWILLTES